ncbi:putative Metastasis-associated protein MTA1 [Hypsibius exemplaris]|uniref:Metastasis-associated protein MTA1 n=1 Tax=Hypsibius exemplaris TaxID=2072580 RepID=A0A1W0X843_HYPEX|nr:putative Metastasis-associated protein MTA1 [Hypsibius exemplaris]
MEQADDAVRGDAAPSSSEERITANGISDAASASSLNLSGSSASDTLGNPKLSAKPALSPQLPERMTYSVGDHLFFETSPSGPFQIRRVDDFVKNGNSVDARVFVYSRKADLPFAVQKEISGFIDGDLDDSTIVPLHQLIAERNAPSPHTQRQLLDHFISSREVFLNKDDSGPVVETLPTSLIRGKCSVLHHVVGAPKHHYTEVADTFFYHRSWYIPTDLQTGEIIVDQKKQIQYDETGTWYQAAIPRLLSAEERAQYESSCTDKATLAWIPNRIPDEDILTFIQAAIAVGLMARCVSASTIASLALREELSTVSKIAGMDCSMVAAYDLLHGNNYDLARSVSALVGEGLWSKRSLLETFDDIDMSFFRIGLHETSRDLKAIHEEWLPWRSFSDLVSFYYLFKTTSYYKAFRTSKAGAKQEKGVITCVSMAAYETRSCLIRHVPEGQVCYGCYEEADTWYAWSGLARSRRQVRALCTSCWDFWKRYGCLKRPWKSPSQSFVRKNPTPLVIPTRPPSSADLPPCFSPTAPKATISVAKQLLLTHRSPPPPQAPQVWVDEVKGWVVEKSQADEEEFQFTAGDEWRLARRVAGESQYDPKQLARYPLLACGDTEQTEGYFRSCPGLVVDFYRKSKGRKKLKMEQVISRISKRPGD